MTDELAVQLLARDLLAQGRDEEAAEAWRGLVRAEPESPSAEYGLAAVLYAIDREDEAEAAARRAVAKGMQGALPWLFLARLMNLQSRFEEAEAAYREAVEREPQSEEGRRELAQLVWMRTADLPRARAVLDEAAQTPAITALTVKLLQDAGDDAGAYALAGERALRDPSLHLLAGRAAVRADPEAADRHLKLVPPWVNHLARGKGEIEADLAL